MTILRNQFRLLYFSAIQIMGLTSSRKASSCDNHTSSTVPIVYHENYNIAFFGLENVLHSFDSKKYGKVFGSVSEHLGFTLEDCFVPNSITESQLLTVHTKSYLKSLNTPYNVACIAEVPLLVSFPNFLIQNRLLNPMKLATGGTVLASQLALKYGWSVNLSGGYHHAKADEGSGFCFFADIPLAIDMLLKEGKVRRVLIVDLDAHQGNGFQTIHTVKDFNSVDSIDDSKPELSYTVDGRVAILDMFNGDIYPRDKFAAQFINYKAALPSRTSDEYYMNKLKTLLKNALEEHSPDIVFYNAGTDLYEHDPLGSLNISENGIVARDEYVFRTCSLERGVPVVMTLSGGYTPASAGIISRSLVNLVEKGVIQLRPTARE